MRTGSWITALAVTLASGCLVTDQIDFPTPTDYPPEILKAPDGPAIGEIINLNKAEWPNGYTFNVRVRDRNVEQELTGRLRLVKRGVMPSFQPIVVQRGDKPEREVSVQVDTNSLDNLSCHRLDLVVSGSFADIMGEQPIFDGVIAGSNDIAYATWWIYEGDLDAVNAMTCPLRFTVTPPAAGRGPQ